MPATTELALPTDDTSGDALAAADGAGAEDGTCADDAGAADSLKLG
jgi:hypothetical protein